MRPPLNVLGTIELTLNTLTFRSFLDQLYSAAKGHGSFMNETIRLPLVSPAPSLPSLSRALLGIECESFPLYRHPSRNII